MADLYTPIDNIGVGKIIMVRIIRLYSRSHYPSSKCKPALEMVLMDDKGSKIEAQVRSYMIWRFAKYLKEFSTITISSFGLIENSGSLRFTKHSQKISFLPNTIVTACDNLAIPKYGFQFVDFSGILTGTVESNVLIDIIGELIEFGDVESTTKDGIVRQRIHIKLEDLSNNKLSCTLWGEYAMQLSEYLAGCKDGRIIVILQFAKFGHWQNELYISNSFYGSRLILDQSMPEIVEFKMSGVKEGTSTSHTISYISTQPHLDIAAQFLQSKDRKLLSDIVDINETSVYVTMATITEIEDKLNWFYNSCKKCKRKVETDGEHFYCLRCDKQVDFPIPRFRLQLKVSDDTGDSSFVMFDHDVQSLINKTVTTLREEQMKHGDVDSFPEVLNCLLNKTFLFRFEISAYYSNKGKKSHTIKKMTADETIIEQFKAAILSMQDTNSEICDSENHSTVCAANEMITPQKRPLEIVDVEVDAVKTQMSSTKMLKEVKIEKLDE